MGQAIAKLNDKFLTGEDRSDSQETTGMLHDVTVDENDLHTSVTELERGDSLEISPKTPPNALKLKFDPRSPTDFDRTPIKILDSCD